MKFPQFMQLRKSDPSLKGRYVECHIGYVPGDDPARSFNCQLTPQQAIDLAKELRRQAKILVDHEVDDAVHLWWKAQSESQIWCGTHTKTKTPGRNKKAASR